MHWAKDEKLFNGIFSSFRQQLCHNNKTKYNFNQSNITACSTSWVTNDEASTDHQRRPTTNRSRFNSEVYFYL